MITDTHLSSSSSSSGVSLVLHGYKCPNAGQLLVIAWPGQWSTFHHHPTTSRPWGILFSLEWGERGRACVILVSYILQTANMPPCQHTLNIYHHYHYDSLTFSKMSLISPVSSELGRMMFMAYFLFPTSTSGMASAPVRLNLWRGGSPALNSGSPL